MRALQVVGAQTPPELRTVDDPEPGPGEVLVKVGGAGACHSDLHVFHDFPELAWPVPFTLGHENAGWVAALGAGVRGWEVGQPVAVYGPWGCGRCHRCRLGMENYCERQAAIGAAGGGLGLDGGMAAHLLVPDARLLVPLGDLDPVEAAPLTDAGLTPYHAIARSRHLLHPGTNVVVVGAGGLGHMAVQILAALCPATVTVIDRKPDALALARSVGATHGVLAGDDAVAEVRDLTGGAGAELVLDFVGTADTMALGAAVARPLGHLTVVGIGGGTLPFSFFTVPYEVSVATTYWGSLPELMEVIAMARQGQVRAHVERFSLEEAPRAYEMLAAGELAGRAVIVP